MPVCGDPRHLPAALFFLAPLFLSAPLARADDRSTVAVPGETKATASRLAEADRLFVAKKWSEGLDELQAVLDTAGDDLVPVDATQSVRARRLVHERIARLPPEGLQQYRKRADVRARRLLDQGATTRDAATLRKVAEEWFCSRPGERALELLGDLAFERGRFAEAETWWQLLVPAADAAKSPGRFAYPDPQGDVARVRAKQLMALHFQGHDERRRDHRLAAFVARHGAEEGVLGGRYGKYVDFLRDLFARPAFDHDGQPEWSTFGGDGSRGAVQPTSARLLDRLGVLCRESPAWRINLPTFRLLDDEVNAPGAVLSRADYARSLAFHPLIVGGRLFVADAVRVTAFDLRRTGSPGVNLYDLGFSAPRLQLDQRHTLTVADGCLYARLGQPQVDEKAAAATGGNAKAFENRIVSIRLEPAPGESAVRWVERGLSGANSRRRGRVIFEGAPVVREGLVYVAATRFETDRRVTAVHCYAAEPATAANGDEPPEPVLRWHTDVCEEREPGAAPRYRHRLLTLAGPLVISCGQNGVVVALDAATGHPAWASHVKARPLTYEAKPPLTDLAPCVYADGRVYAAPGEGCGLVCLDAETGRTLWHREVVEVVHLLGVGTGRVIFTTPTGLRALDAETGSDGNGWSHEARTEYGKDGNRVGWTPAGRGFLAGDYVFWPAIDGAGGMNVFALRQGDGQLEDDPTLLHRLPLGNLVFAEGCLAVAGRDELVVFVPPGWRLPERERGVKAAPGSADAALALARSESDKGLVARAAESYVRAERLATRDRRLREKAKSERQKLWLDAGRRAAAAQRWAEAKEAFGRATTAEYLPPERARALLEVARVWYEAERLPEWATALETIVDDDKLREAPLPWWDTVGSLAYECLAHCKLTPPAEQEKRAATALAAAKDAAVLARVARRFPYTDSGRMALERLARAEEQAGHPGGAADCWRRLLGVTFDGPPASALAGLARNCERQGCTGAARRYWECLAETSGDKIIPDVDPSRPLRKFVADRLLTLPDEASSVKFPLRTAWEQALDPDEELLPMPGSDVFVTTGRGSSPYLVCRDVDTGKKRWSVSLPFHPCNAFAHDDLILAAGSAGVAALRREDGIRSWSFLPPEKHRAEPLVGFRLFAGRLFCFCGGCLVSFSADYGEVWRVREPDAGLHPPAPAGRFVPHFAPVGDQVLVQSSRGNRVTYKINTGSTGRTFGPAKAWTSDPVPIGNDLLTVEGDRRVTLLGDGARWSYTVPGFTTLSGRPARVAAVGDAILLLVQTNIGYELQRLDHATGKPLWPMALLLGEPVADPADWAAGDGTVFLVEGGVLTARSLLDGKRVWETPVGDPRRSWRVERLSGGLLAYPTATTARHFGFRWLSGRLQWNLVPDVAEAFGRGYPLVCCDTSGRVVQRLDLPAGGPALRTDRSLSASFSVAPRAAVWRGPAKECQPVQVSPRGVLVVVGPRARGLIPATAK
jgi:outer membrane protein assembly factor BamB/tetratricopeptide (TPR) repeat protein